MSHVDMEESQEGSRRKEQPGAAFSASLLSALWVPSFLVSVPLQEAGRLQGAPISMFYSAPCTGPTNLNVLKGPWVALPWPVKQLNAG